MTDHIAERALKTDADDLSEFAEQIADQPDEARHR